MNIADAAMPQYVRSRRQTGLADDRLQTSKMTHSGLTPAGAGASGVLSRELSSNYGCGPAANDFATSRAHSMKRSTAGLKVRFFSVTTAVGQGRVGKSTGSNFNNFNEK